MVAGWNPSFFLKHQFHILRFPNSTGLVTKPNGCHYTKYRFSPNIGSISAFQRLLIKDQGMKRKESMREALTR